MPQCQPLHRPARIFPGTCSSSRRGNGTRTPHRCDRCYHPFIHRCVGVFPQSRQRSTKYCVEISLFYKLWISSIERHGDTLEHSYAIFGPTTSGCINVQCVSIITLTCGVRLLPAFQLRHWVPGASHPGTGVGAGRSNGTLLTLFPFLNLTFDFEPSRNRGPNVRCATLAASGHCRTATLRSFAEAATRCHLRRTQP